MVKRKEKENITKVIAKRTFVKLPVKEGKFIKVECYKTYLKKHNE